MAIDNIRTLENAEAEYLSNRVKALQKVPGNPYSAQLFGKGEKLSFLVAKNPGPMNSRMCGVDLDAPDLPEEVLAEFNKASADIYIPVVGKPAEVKAKSIAIGATPLRGWTHGQFAADIDDLLETSVDQQTRRLRSQDIEHFVQIHAKEFGYSNKGYDMALDMFSNLLKTNKVEAYACYVNAKPVAIGLLYFAKNKVGYLATAATSKSARKQGAHTALIACRIEAARKRGAQRIFSTALLNSQSRRNLEKAGLKLSHVQTIITISHS